MEASLRTIDPLDRFESRVIAVNSRPPRCETLGYPVNNLLNYT
jgi:hypothetical protein